MPKDCQVAGVLGPSPVCIFGARSATEPQSDRAKRFRILVAYCLATLIVFTASAAKSQLPKIRVADDNRTFVTESGKPFVPLGVTYYRPGTGWAPQVWKKFDAEATRSDFARMKQLGINCVRVFLSFGSFYTQPGVLREEGLARFDAFLSIAEESGIYVHPTGPDHWEGAPDWSPVAVEDEATVRALESFWRLFAARYRGRNVIFAYDLRNEPEVGWNDAMAPAWKDWLRIRYPAAEKHQQAWGTMNSIELGRLTIPPTDGHASKQEIMDFQTFRESLAERWTSRQTAAIRAADPTALVTVGLIQWSIPSLLPAGPRHYAGFRPTSLAKYLDFLEVHFYPLERGAYEYRTEADEWANLAYLEGVVREVARAGKPVVLAEFGWYGGGKPGFDSGVHPFASETQQARYCRRVVETSAGFAVGWLNWGLYDQPEAGDCSELTGLMRPNGELKEWGRTFQELAGRFSNRRMALRKLGPRPSLNWESCVTGAEAGNEFRRKYLEAFLEERPTKAP